MNFLWVTQSGALSRGLSWGMCFQWRTADAHSGKQKAGIPLSDKANPLQKFLVCILHSFKSHSFTFLHIGIKLQNDWVEIFMKCKKHVWKNSTRNSVHSLALWLTKPTPMTLLTINASVTALEAAHAHSACTHSFHSDSLYSQPDRHTCSCYSCPECMSHHEDMEMKNKLQKKSKNVHGLS